MTKSKYGRFSSSRSVPLERDGERMTNAPWVNPKTGDLRGVSGQIDSLDKPGPNGGLSAAIPNRKK